MGWSEMHPAGQREHRHGMCVELTPQQTSDMVEHQQVVRQFQEERVGRERLELLLEMPILRRHQVDSIARLRQGGLYLEPVFCSNQQ